MTIEDCEIGHVGTYAVWFRRGCRDDLIRHCHLHDLGAGGIRLGETAIRPEERDRTSHITVDNNIIHRGGRIFPCAVGLWIGQSGDNRVTHNEIADLYHIGISAGWTWGYGQNLVKRNTLAFNHVHCIGQGVLSDMGGIYTMGLSEGTVVANNVLHDIYAYSYGGWGLYTDEGCTGILFENNLVYDTKSGGFHQHYGTENVVRNNIFAFSKTRQLAFTRRRPNLSFTLEKNIVYWSGTDEALDGAEWPGPMMESAVYRNKRWVFLLDGAEHRGQLIGRAWDRGPYIARNNWYWNDGGKVTFRGQSLAEWQAKGHEQGTQIVDPLFVDPARRNFRLRPESPVLQAGFKPFDPAAAGVYGATGLDRQSQRGAVSAAGNCSAALNDLAGFWEKGASCAQFSFPLIVHLNSVVRRRR